MLLYLYLSEDTRVQHIIVYSQTRKVHTRKNTVIIMIMVCITLSANSHTIGTRDGGGTRPKGLWFRCEG